MTLSLFSLLFLAALITGTSLHLWLNARQISFIQSKRSAVPLEFAETISLEAHQHSADYSIAKCRFKQLETLFEAAVLLALTLGGGIDWLNDFSQQVFTSPIASGLLLILSVMLIQSLLGLPFAWYSTFNIEARFGFNKMTAKLFFIDLIKSTLLGALIGIPLLSLVLWLMGQMGAQWWLWVWLAWVSFAVVMMIVFPTWIAPLFNKFEPLSDDTLKSSIERLLQRCGFATSGVFVMDGSKRSSHGNAYFTGLGKSKRIVFFDTLLKQLSEAEILAVLAHELGHFHHRHVFKRLIWTFISMLGLLYLLGQLMGQNWFYQGLGVYHANTAAALLLFFMVLPVFTFIFTPLGSWLSRKQEFEADRFAAQHAASSDLIAGLVKLYRDNASTLTPDPLYSVFYYSHPPATIRIAALKALD